MNAGDRDETALNDCLRVVLNSSSSSTERCGERGGAATKLTD